MNIRIWQNYGKIFKMSKTVEQKVCNNLQVSFVTSFEKQSLKMKTFIKMYLNGIIKLFLIVLSQRNQSRKSPFPKQFHLTFGVYLSDNIATNSATHYICMCSYFSLYFIFEVLCKKWQWNVEEHQKRKRERVTYAA